MRPVITWMLRGLCGIAWFAWFVDKPILAFLAIYWPLALFVSRWERQPAIKRAYTPPAAGPVLAQGVAPRSVKPPPADTQLIEDTIASLVALGERKKQAQQLARSAIAAGATTIGEAIAIAYRKQ